MKNILITGISSGIGKALALEFAQNDYKVYGVSRRPLDYSHPNIIHEKKDITEQELNLPNKLEIAILNAGVLGEIQDLTNSDLNSLKRTMDINLWAQKLICDQLLKQTETKHIFGISSGAAIKGTKGWSGYSLSKAAFKMLLEIYANENSQTHFLNIAPGLVNTQMQDQLCDKVDHNEFPNIKRLKDARENGTMLSPTDLAKKFFSYLNDLQSLESGSFIDLRSFE